MSQDNSEFDAFFRKAYPSLVRHMMQTGLGEESAKDSAQHAMAMAYEGWSELIDPDAWVRKVARRYAGRTWYRDLTRIRKETEALRRSPTRTEAPSPEERLNELEQRETVLEALRRLPLAQRTVVAWLLDGYTTNEIARHTGTDPGTVRSHLRYARERLRPYLEGREGGDDE